MQNSGVSEGNKEVESIVRRRGTLLIRKDRNRDNVCRCSLRKAAFDRTSKAATIRSLVKVDVLSYRFIRLTDMETRVTVTCLVPRV